jgi:hypothetical protein
LLTAAVAVAVVPAGQLCQSASNTLAYHGTSATNGLAYEVTVQEEHRKVYLTSKVFKVYTKAYK